MWVCLTPGCSWITQEHQGGTEIKTELHLSTVEPGHPAPLRTDSNFAICLNFHTKTDPVCCGQVQQLHDAPWPSSAEIQVLSGSQSIYLVRTTLDSLPHGTNLGISISTKQVSELRCNLIAAIPALIGIPDLFLPKIFLYF